MEFIQNFPKRNLRQLCLILGCLVAVPVHAADSGRLAGHVALLKGRALAQQGGETTALYLQASVLTGDRIQTRNKTRLRLQMVDGTEIILGDNTEFQIGEYHYDAVTNLGHGSLALVKGFFRALTGKIAKLQNQPFEVKTPTAVIGVRGTDFWGEQHPNKLRVALIGGGGVTIRNNAGSVDIDTPGYGTEVTSLDVAPVKPFPWSPAAIKRAMGTVD